MKVLKNLITTLLFYSGVISLFRFVYRNKVIIIYYHKIHPTIFENHVKYLKKKYTIISLQTFLSNKSKNEKNRLIITFDDGHVDNFKLLPILKKYSVPITVFITTGLINTKKGYWFSLEGLTNPIKKMLKTLSDEQRLSYLKENFDYSDEKNFDSPQSLSITQIENMSEWVDFQSHTITHPCLIRCNAEKSLLEISGSKLELEKITGKEVNTLAFPNGDYSEREVEFALNSGYKCLMSGIPGVNNTKKNMVVMFRNSTGDTSNTHELALRVVGLWFMVRKLFK